MAIDRLPERIYSLQRLVELVDERRAVWRGPGKDGLLAKPLPAAVVINWSGAMLGPILVGGLYVYVPFKKSLPITAGQPERVKNLLIPSDARDVDSSPF